MTIQGVYVGNDTNAFAQAESWSGNAFSANTIFIGQASWADFDGGVGYEINLWNQTPATKLWSIPLIVNGASLATAAQGGYDAHYLAAAQKLANSTPNGPIYIRTGWEFNGSWMPWAAAGNDANYVAAYQDFVNVFRSVSNRFVFTWTPNIGGSSDPSKDYPGDKYVDIVGMDFYYNTQWDSTNANAAWNYKVSEPYGLQWLENFAAQHGKPTAYPEWGINSNGAAAYVQDAANWFSSHNVVYEAYWNSNAAFSGQLSTGQYPSTSQAFLNDFANSQISSTQPLVEVDTYGATGAKVYADFYNGNNIAREEGYDLLSGTKTLMITHMSTQSISTRYDLTGRIIEQNTYNTSGGLVSSVVFNNDGSSLDKTYDGNGHLSRLDGYSVSGQHISTATYNGAGSLIEQDNYNAAGQEVLSHIQNTDGSTYDVATQYVSASDSRVVSTDVTQSSGSIVFTLYDPTAATAFTSRVDSYTGYCLVNQVTNNRDLSVIVETFDPTSSQTWSDIKKTFSPSGALTEEVDKYHSGKSIDTHYNSTGQVVDVQGQNADGTGYEVKTQYVSGSDSRVVSTDFIQSNGSIVFTLYDPTAFTAFTSRVDSYTGYHLVNQVTNNRDLSVIVETFDPTSSQTWSDIKKIYAPSGALAEEFDKYHDGTSTDTHYDVNNSQVWSSTFVAYDNQGRQVSTLETFHNGTSQVEVFNPTGTAGYQDYIDTKTATGAVQTHEVDYADGSRAMVQYDVANTQVWASETFGYDNQGRTTYEDIVNHDGTSSVTTYDVAMTSSELYHTYSYSAAGQQTFLHVVYTNGTTYDHSFM